MYLCGYMCIYIYIYIYVYMYVCVYIEFELSYFEATVQHFIQYNTRNLLFLWRNKVGVF